MIAERFATTGDWVIVGSLFGVVLLALVGMCVADLRDEGYPWRGIVWRALWMMTRPIPGAALRVLSMVLPPARRPGPTKAELQKRIDELEGELGV